MMKFRYIIFSIIGGLYCFFLLTGCPDEPELSGEKVITAYSFEAEDNLSLSASVTGTIEITETAGISADILVTVPYGTDLTALVAAFTAASGAAVTVDGIVQESGVTANDFTDPVTYTVTAEDGTTREYTAAVTIAPPSTDKEITSFSFPAAENGELYTDIAGIIPPFYR
ncbi:MAG: hypothetical protein ACLFST_04225 [Spirochaetia bacterium]